MASKIAMENRNLPPDDVAVQLRKLSHDLSNALEAILQASYLVGQSKLDPTNKKWVRMIDTAAQDAARINRGMRELLKKVVVSPQAKT